MKKVLPWIQWISFATFLIVWLVIGVQIADGKYDFSVEAYVAYGCLGVFSICLLIRAFSDRCPHCGKLRMTRGAYCSYCGKKIEK